VSARQKDAKPQRKGKSEVDEERIQYRRVGVMRKTAGKWRWMGGNERYNDKDEGYRQFYSYARKTS